MSHKSLIKALVHLEQDVNDLVEPDASGQNYISHRYPCATMKAGRHSNPCDCHVGNKVKLLLDDLAGLRSVIGVDK